MMLLPRLSWALLASLALLAACGGDDRPAIPTDSGQDLGPDMGSGMDASMDEGVDMPPDMEEEEMGLVDQMGADIDDALCPDIDPVGVDHLIITQVRIAQPLFTQGRVEIHNPTSEPIDVSVDRYWLESRPADRELDGILDGDSIIDPGEFITLVMPSNFDVEVGRQELLEPFDGEIALYRGENQFGNRENMVDFICWGDTPEPGPGVSTRLGTAHDLLVEGDNTSSAWYGPCAPELDEELLTIRRRYGRRGNNGNDYETAQDFVERDCSTAE
ncbi:MAG: hypothetical protein AAGH15_04200 [Myxococcota bacterium]